MRTFPRRALLILSTLAALAPAAAHAEDGARAALNPPGDSITRQRYKVAGADAAFTVTAGSLPILDDKGERQGSIFYTAYVRDGAPRDKRPVSFVFNGGPGASSAYLHLGALGPRVLDFGTDGRIPTPPGKLVDNPDHWLDLTDLVFIDPVGTGYSRPAVAGDEAYRKFWGVKEDLESLAKFIELYLQRNNRQTSPKYIVGESYGGFRGARLPLLLARDHGIGLAGVFLISPVLEFRLASSDNFAVLPDAVRLPSYAAVALERTATPTPEALLEVERFALGPYITTLAGSAANTGGLKEVYARIARYTGLPEDVVERNGGRISLQTFIKEFRRGDRLLLSPYDGSATGPDPYPDTSKADGDPVFDGLRSVLNDTITDYLSDKLGVRTDLPYRLANGETARQWNWWSGLYGQGGFQGAGDQLREAMAGNRGMKVVVAHGMTDLVTPYFASKFVIERLPPNLLGDRVTLNLYAGGHMMYARPASRTRLHADAAKFYPAPAK
jgi:carboxypeptidase C (cathepsin A)